MYYASFRPYINAFNDEIDAMAKTLNTPNAIMYQKFSRFVLHNVIKNDAMILSDTFRDDLDLLGTIEDLDTMLSSDLGKRMLRYCSYTIKYIRDIRDVALSKMNG